MDGFKIFVHILAGLITLMGLLAIILTFLFFCYVWVPEVKRNAEERENCKKSSETLSGLTFGLPPCDVQTV